MGSADSIYGRSIARAPSQQLAVSRFISRTYGWMCVGLILTSVVSIGIASSGSAIEWIFGNQFVFYGILIAEIALVFGLNAAYRKLSALAATLGFLAYSALNGVTFSVIFLTYTSTSVGQIFLITAGMFGGLAALGSATKKDLTSVGAFFGMGLWGMILVGLVNSFIQSDALSFGFSVAGVLIFSGLTAYEAQRIRSLAYQYAEGSFGSQEESKGAIFAALSLYLKFINLFLSLLRLFGNKRQ